MTAPQFIYCRLHPPWNISDFCRIPASSAHYRSRMARAKRKAKNQIATSLVSTISVIVSVAVDVLGDTMTVMATSVASHNDAMQR